MPQFIEPPWQSEKRQRQGKTAHDLSGLVHESIPRATALTYLLPGWNRFADKGNDY
jgi:hypothetical protein